MTNKEIIQEIREEQKVQALKILELSAQVSEMLNKQDRFNQKIETILLNDESTGKSGLVEEFLEVKKRVTDLEVFKSLTTGKITVGVAIVSGIGTVVWWVIKNILLSIKQ